VLMVLQRGRRALGRGGGEGAGVLGRWRGEGAGVLGRWGAGFERELLHSEFWIL